MSDTYDLPLHLFFILFKVMLLARGNEGTWNKRLLTYTLIFGYMFAMSTIQASAKVPFASSTDGTTKTWGWGAQGNWDINSVLDISLKTLLAFLIALFLVLETSHLLLSIFGDFR